MTAYDYLLLISRLDATNGMIKTCLQMSYESYFLLYNTQLTKQQLDD